MMLALLLFAAALLVSAVHVGGMVVAALVVGVPLQEVRLGAGVSLFRFRLRGVACSFGGLPLGGSVKFVEEAYPRAGPWRQLAIALAGCGVLAAAGVLLGAPVESALRAPAQLVQGALAPVEVGAPLIRALRSGLEHSFWLALGHLALKVAIVNLLPVRHLNGGQVLVSLGALLGVRLPKWVGTAWVILGLLASLALVVGWSVALVVGLRR